MQGLIQVSDGAGDTRRDVIGPRHLSTTPRGRVTQEYIRGERANKGSGAPGYRRGAPGAEYPETRSPGTLQTTTPLAGVTIYTRILFPPLRYSSPPPPNSEFSKTVYNNLQNIVMNANCYSILVIFTCTSTYCVQITIVQIYTIDQHQ